MIITKPIQLAVIFDQVLYAGGGFQQALNAALDSKKISQDIANVTFYTYHDSNIKILEDIGINAKVYNLNIFDRFERIIRQRIRNQKLLKLWKYFFKYSKFESIMINNRIDIVYFLSPTILFKDLEITNYIATVWDLCHRDFPEFPEIRDNKTFQIREKMYVEMLPKAVAIIVDSKLGKENVVKRYLIDSDRVCIIPFSPSISCKISEELYIKNYVDIS
jgi:hypothetical protein